MAGFLKLHAARTVDLIEAGWRQWVARLGAVMAAVVLVTVVLVVWRILSFDIENTEEATNQGLLLVAVTGLVGTAVLMATTIYYAVQTKYLVDEARGAREREDARHAEQLRLDRNREIEGTVAALQGASLDLLKTGTILLAMRRNWRLWRVRQAEPLMQAMTSASQATDLLRHRAAGPVLLAANDMHDTLLDLMQLFMSGADDGPIHSATETMADRKRSLDSALALHVSGALPSSSTD